MYPIIQIPPFIKTESYTEQYISLSYHLKPRRAEKIKFPQGYKVELLQGNTKRKSQLFLLKDWWIDSFFLKIVFLVSLLFGAWLCFVLLPSFQWEEWNTLDSLSIYIRIQALFLLYFIILLRFCDLLPHHYLTIRSKNKNLVSVYLCWRIDSAELYVFSKGLTPRDQAIKASLIQHVAKVVDAPVYLVCDRQHCDFYMQMGFQPVAKHKLPFILKVTSQASGVGMCYCPLHV
jgi:hypothetical protein